MNHYFPTETPPKELKIHTDYSLGGPNILNGQTEGRGLYVYFQLVERNQGGNGSDSETIELFSKGNFKMFAFGLGRRSAKRLAELDDYVAANAKPMAALYNAGLYEPLYQIVRGFNPPLKRAA